MTTTTTRTLSTVTKREIRELREAAGAAGDRAMVAVCDRALNGSARAYREAARVVLAGLA